MFFSIFSFHFFHPFIHEFPSSNSSFIYLLFCHPYTHALSLPWFIHSFCFSTILPFINLFNFPFHYPCAHATFLPAFILSFVHSFIHSSFHFAFIHYLLISQLLLLLIHTFAFTHSFIHPPSICLSSCVITLYSYHSLINTIPSPTSHSLIHLLSCPFICPSSLLLLRICWLSFPVHERHRPRDDSQAPGDQQGQRGVPGAHDTLVLEGQEDRHIALCCDRQQAQDGALEERGAFFNIHIKNTIAGNVQCPSQQKSTLSITN